MIIVFCITNVSKFLMTTYGWTAFPKDPSLESVKWCYCHYYSCYNHNPTLFFRQLSWSFKYQFQTLDIYPFGLLSRLLTICEDWDSIGVWSDLTSLDLGNLASINKFWISSDTKYLVHDQEHPMVWTRVHWSITFTFVLRLGFGSS